MTPAPGRRTRATRDAALPQLARTYGYTPAQIDALSQHDFLLLCADVWRPPMNGGPGNG